MSQKEVWETTRGFRVLHGVLRPSLLRWDGSSSRGPSTQRGLRKDPYRHFGYRPVGSGGVCPPRPEWSIPTLEVDQSRTRSSENSNVTSVTRDRTGFGRNRSLSKGPKRRGDGSNTLLTILSLPFVFRFERVPRIKHRRETRKNQSWFRIRGRKDT